MRTESKPDQSFRVACVKVLTVFLDRVRQDNAKVHAELAPRVRGSFQLLLPHSDSLAGKPETWAGGLAYAANRWLLTGDRTGVLNAELERIFGTSMSTIRKRAEQVWPLIEPKLC